MGSVQSQWAPTNLDSEARATQQKQQQQPQEQQPVQSAQAAYEQHLNDDGDEDINFYQSEEQAEPFALREVEGEENNESVASVTLPVGASASTFCPFMQATLLDRENGATPDHLQVGNPSHSSGSSYSSTHQRSGMLNDEETILTLNPIVDGNTSRSIIPGVTSRYIEVSNLKTTTGRDTIKLYFENTFRSDGGPLEDVRLDCDSGKAIITFVHADDAVRVLQKPHVLENRSLLLQMITPPPASNTVVVRGFSELTTQDCILHYFENTPRSNGGPVTGVELDTQQQMARVQFADPSDAENVCQRDHVLDGHDLSVRLFIHAEKVKDSIILGQLPQLPVYGDDHTDFLPQSTTYRHRRSRSREVTSVVSPILQDEGDDQCGDYIHVQSLKEHLMHFVEKTTGADVKDILVNDDKSKAIVQFSQAVDVCKIKAALKMKKFMNQELTVDPVSETHTIKVRNIPSQPHSPTVEFLTNYFENRRRNDGGEVLRVDLDKSAGCAVVVFCDPKVAHRVAQRQHFMQGSLLDVSLSHNCLAHQEWETVGDFSQSVPDPVQLSDRDRIRVSYLMSFPGIYLRLASSLEKECCAYIDVEYHPEKIFLACCATAEGAGDILPSWSEQSIAVLQRKLEATKVQFEPATYEETEEVKGRLVEISETPRVEVSFDEYKKMAVIVWDDPEYDGVVKKLFEVFREVKSAWMEKHSNDDYFWMSF